MLTGSPRISVIIPTYNRGELLIRTVNHFLELLSGDDELVIIDQSDTPSPILLEMQITNRQLTYLHIKEKGLPNARNVGVQHASGKIILFCDDDTIPQPGLINAHVRAYDDPTIGAVAGRVILHGTQPCSDSAFGTIRQADFRIIGHFSSMERKRVDHFQGCNFSVSRQVFHQGVLSDKRFGGTAHLEESDLALQITEKGFRILFEPEAALVHLIQAGGGCRMPDMGRWLYWYGHNYMLLQLKHGRRVFLPFFVLVRLTKLFLTAVTAKNPGLLVKGVQGLIDGGISYFGQRETVSQVNEP
ncbi:MAG: glycosyltransferase family 2 protein [Proteobacteria bacterium]|nr:glycosyltransferase family 2 protein [Desulfobulbaceae bacterium]MBU4154127.1 glycosyltransferase family 2 protein [Pseudomonadota bacterium]